MRRWGLLLAAAGLLLPAPALARDKYAELRAILARTMREAGSLSGAYVLNASEHRVVFSLRSRTPRRIASNAKLFTTAAALAAFGPAATFQTTALAAGLPGPDGVLHGDLFIRGGGDPTFGSRQFADRAYGGGGTVEDLVAALAAANVRRVTGDVVGDESLFDSVRGPPGWELNPTPPGPISALPFDRGLEEPRLHDSPFVADPPSYAAAKVRVALEDSGVAVGGGARAGLTPPGAVRLAAVSSPTVGKLIRLINKNSDNFLAEALAKSLGVRTVGRGTSAAGLRAVAAFARGLGVQPILVDPAGADLGDRAPPRDVVRFLDRMRRQPGFPLFGASLPIAGRDGSLGDRTRNGAAMGRCQAKTGTFGDPGVSNLSGYCEALNGDVMEFSFLMDGILSIPAHRLQDRMANALVAAWGSD